MHLRFENIMRGGIVSFKGCASARLFVAHFFERGDNRNSLLTSEKEPAGFGFSSGSRNTTNSFTEYMNGTVGLRVRRIGGRDITEEEKSSTTTASIG